MELPKLSARKIINLLFDEYHSESFSCSAARALEIQPDNQENSSYQVAADLLEKREFRVCRNVDQVISAALLQDVDVLALVHPCDPRYERTTSSNSPKLSSDEIAAVHRFVHGGGGLVVITEYENDKYGNNLNDLLAEFGILVENTTVIDRNLGLNEEKTHVLGVIKSEDNALVGVSKTCFYRTATCKVYPPARLLVETSTTARPKSSGLIAVAEYYAGRVVVVCDSDLFSDSYITKFDHSQLWTNLIYWVSYPRFSKRLSAVNDSVSVGTDWVELKTLINKLRLDYVQQRQANGSYQTSVCNPERIAPLVKGIVALLENMREDFPHLRDYLTQAVKDFGTWEATGFLRPNFSKSLALFNPQLMREEDIRHIVVFPMYTPNNSLDIHFEALLFKVPWYPWLASIENAWFPEIATRIWPNSSGGAKLRFRNDKFVPGHLLDYSEGYNSECAVLFPETVSVEGPANNNFGVIFCDREAARFQRCVLRCVDILQVNAPPDLTGLLSNLDLVRDMFAAWDLVHDTSHSMGPLPFDPFMVRQLAPYWMYALEELRVDLRSVRISSQLINEGFVFAKSIQYGVLFDRIFRFAITGSRIKNYDGLAGQLLFAALHKKKALLWENNRLTIVWEKAFQEIEKFSSELEEVYDSGADQSRVRRYIEGHKFISRYLSPSVNSKWQEPLSLNLPETDFKAWIENALNDEFPLGSFHSQLRRKYEASAAAV